jgi:hypothetical protein
MSCFCDTTATLAQHSVARMSLRFTPPVIPIQMKIVAALGLAMDPNRVDIRIAAAIQNIQTPPIMIGGRLASIAASLQLAGGVFKIDDIPMLDFQMKQAAASFMTNVWPRLAPLSLRSLLPIINLALIARLVLQMKALGIDPLNLATAPAPNSVPPSSFAMRLTPPQLKLAKILIGLPPLITLAQTLKIPLGEQTSASMARNHLMALAKLQPPTLPIAMPRLLRLASLFESLGTIQEAFGPDAMTPVGLTRISAMLKPFLRLALPIPLPALKLAEALALLPPLDAVKIGAENMNAPAWAKMSFTPPRLAIAPFLNVMVALNLSLNKLLGIPVLDACAACNSLKGALSDAVA